MPDPEAALLPSDRAVTTDGARGASAAPPAAPASTPLGASLRADYEALKNDLEQATELAADFQRQLAGKSNEVAHFKNVLERTQRDLNRLEAHVQELRQERHRLANESMRCSALELELKKSREENERLKTQLGTLRDAGGNRVHELLVVSEEQQREISRLRAALEVLKNAKPEPPVTDQGGMQKQIHELTTLVKRLQGALDSQCRADRPKAAGRPESNPDVINLSFES